ncbi:MAG TPA: hypothetical protein DEA08_16295 [Planctomycetes bacterium]|nr:hypothetical protein [Planctomycetota bacterium]|tara:strand:- start:789 stop:1589 length:801 start_codon:yes stop_codon:yes gene_type:complete
MTEKLGLLACVALVIAGILHASSQPEEPAPKPRVVAKPKAPDRVPEHVLGDYSLELGNIPDKLDFGSRWCFVNLAEGEGNSLEVKAWREGDTSFAASEPSAKVGSLRFKIVRSYERDEETVNETWKITLKPGVSQGEGPVELKGVAAVIQSFDWGEAEAPPPRSYRYHVRAIPVEPAQVEEELAERAEARSRAKLDKDREEGIPEEILRDLPYEATEKGELMQELQKAIDEGRLKKRDLPYGLQRRLSKAQAKGEADEKKGSGDKK